MICRFEFSVRFVMICRFEFSVRFVMGLSCGALVNARRFLRRNDANLEIQAQSLPHLRDKFTPHQTCALKRKKK
jgi:hypothetical protein